MFIILLLLAFECEAKLPCILAPLQSYNYPNNGVCELEEFTFSVLPTSPNIEFETVVEFIASSNLIGSVCSEVMGVVGDIDLKTASIIHTLASRTNISITLVSAVAPSTFIPTTNLDLPNLLHMYPLQHYVEALTTFLDHLNWTRIGMISDDSHYYGFAAELTQQRLLENPERQIIPFVRISERDNRIKTIHTFKEYETDVIVVSTNIDIACSLVQEANNIGFTWPEYAWIIIDVNNNLSLETCQESSVILVRDESILKKFGNHNVSCSYTEMEECINYSSSIIDSVKALLGDQIPAAIGQQVIKFRDGRRLRNISIAQTHRSNSTKDIAFYDSESQQLSLLNFTVGKQPRGTILVIRYSDHNVAVHTAVVEVVFCLSFCFITVILILYIYLRKEPEIKATSVTVSLFMFLACYLMILLLPFMVSSIEAVDIVCRFLQLLSGTSISFPLLLATLFAKMLRIYFIFCDPRSYKKRFFSDRALLLYILLLMSPNFLILLIWLSYDPLRAAEVESVHENVILKKSRCVSTYVIQWHIALIIYCVILAIAVICLALKTSKIRYKNFRDTKATNAFAYLSILIATIAIFYWFYLNSQGLDIKTITIAYSIVYFAHSSIALLCQLFLFVPKVYLPLKRRLNK